MSSGSDDDLYRIEWDSIRTRRRKAFDLASHKAVSEDTGSGTPADDRPPKIESSSTTEQSEFAHEQSEFAQRPKDLVGLSLSGGGLRSALFNDGLLQAFSHRGLLRYVDYLSSVSGGAYIAGHLMSYSTNAAAKSRNFHNDPCGEGSGSKPVWHLGRDPVNGQEDHDRLPAIGSYLKRSAQFLAGYCLRQLPVILLYLSFFGFLATLLALFYRSYDAPLFRAVYFRLLDVQYLNELLIAFIPALITAAVTLGLALVAWSPIPTSLARSERWESRIARIQAVVRFLAKCAFWVTTFLALTSVAVYLGNDLTKASSNRNVASHSRLNHFALQITIAAALTQLLVFFGRDRLFRSEASEAAPWRKFVQHIVIRGTVFLALFAMIHAMARENISNYTTTRDPYLVRGDIGDWETLESLFLEYEALSLEYEALSLENEARRFGPPRGDSVEFPAGSNRGQAGLYPLQRLFSLPAWTERNLLGESSARRNWAFAWDPHESARPPSTAEQRDDSDERKTRWLTPGKRFWWVALSCLCPTPLDDGKSMDQRGEVIESDLVQLPETQQGDHRSWSHLWEVADQVHANQERYLDDHNAILESKLFTEVLLDRLLSSKDSDVSSSSASRRLSVDLPFLGSANWSDELATGNSKTKNTSKSTWRKLNDEPHTKRRLDAMLASRRTQMETLLARHDYDALPQAASMKREQGPLWPRWRAARTPPLIVKRVALNRDLLELIQGAHDGGVVRAIDIASTWVVQPHDQAARWRWALFWLTLLAVSLFLTRDLNRTSYLFDYYRKSIRENFLRPQSGSPESRESRPIDRLCPERSGLPIPIFLATWLKPGPRADAPSTPVALSITPNNTLLHDGGTSHRLTPRVDSGFGTRVATVDDVVATSGAAISPQMTNSPALAIMMDFLGARLGMWFRTQRSGQPQAEARCSQGSTRSASRLTSMPDFVGLGLVVVAVGVVHLRVLYYGLANGGRITDSIIVALLLNVCLVTLLIAAPAGYPKLCVSWIGTWLVRARTASRSHSVRDARLSECWPSIFVSDGGYYDYLGVTELLRRRCELVIVSDAGVNTGSTTFEALAKMCEKASSELGVRFFDLDHDAPIEFSRLRRTDQNVAHQPFLAMRIRYPSSEDPDDARPTEGLLFYIQMTISEGDPIEIQQIRHQFPSFPDEPTTNQFYTNEQVAAYRDLGYHIGSRLCNHLHRWTAEEIRLECDRLGNQRSPANGNRCDVTTNRQPLFQELKQRLIQSYAHDCFNECFVSTHDIFGEAIGTRCMLDAAFPSFNNAVRSCAELTDGGWKIDAEVRSRLLDYWVAEATHNADVAARYLSALTCDANGVPVERGAGQGTVRIVGSNGANGVRQFSESWSEALLLQEIRVWLSRPPKMDVATSLADDFSVDHDQNQEAFEWWRLHLAAMAVAAQRMHHGHLESCLQVGGYLRLSVLLDEVVHRLQDAFLKMGTFDAAPVPISGELAEIVTDSAYKLSGQVFRADDTMGVVSFVQCLCLELVAISRLKPAARNPTEFALDFRQMLLERLHGGYRSETRGLIRDYIEYLYLGSDTHANGHRRLEVIRTFDGSSNGTLNSPR